MIYEYIDYRKYLQHWIKNQPSGGHGMRRKIADYLKCQGTFVSQVLHQSAHFSLEHGYKLNEFLGHTSEEADYFVLMLLYERAGSDETRNYFRSKLEAVHKSRLLLKNRVSTESAISKEDKARYYSAWYYGAIRLLVAMPEFSRKEDIIARLRLPPKTVSDALAFLVSIGLIAENGGRYSAQELHLHLGDDPVLVNKHHTSWRLQALSNLSEGGTHDLHYSLGMTLSREDVVKIKAMLVDWIAELQKVVRPSPSETLCGFCMDWFEV